MEREIELAEYKEKLLCILDEIDCFCNKNDIKYYLDSGTLLGAIRHNGFIPWDDDIDLVMLRDDYEKFVYSFKSDLCSVLSFKNGNDYYYQYAKVNYHGSRVEELMLPEVDGLGINIDIFPIDGMPNNLYARRIHQDILMFLSKFRALVIRIKKKVPPRVGQLLRWRWIVRLLDKLARSYKPETSRFIGNIVATTVRHKEVPKECFDSSLYHEFEGRTYPIPCGFDKYLTILYGNYMELPPIEKRISNHSFRAFIIDKGRS